MNYESINIKYRDFLVSDRCYQSRLIIVYFWAFFESMIWFIAPDFLLALFIFYDRARWWWYVISAIFGSFLGSIIWYYVCICFYDTVQDLLPNIPFIQSDMYSIVQKYLHEYGIESGFFQAFSYISGKLWVFLASRESFSFALFFWAMMISRVFRFSWTALKSGLLGYYFVRHTYKHVILYSVLFFAASIIFLLVVET